MVTFGENIGRAILGVGTFECRTFKLKAVFYVEGLKGNFNSISQLCDVGYKVLFIHHEGKVFDVEKKIMLSALRENDIYMV